MGTITLLKTLAIIYMVAMLCVYPLRKEYLRLINNTKTIKK